jgi:hypothetical protein
MAVCRRQLALQVPCPTSQVLETETRIDKVCDKVHDKVLKNLNPEP